MCKCVVSLFLSLMLSLSAQDKNSLIDKSYSTKIDKIVLYVVKKLKLRPNKNSIDKVFLRRIYLDTIGRIPTYYEYTKFIKMSPATRRSQIIDQLLNSEAYVSHNFNYWADILRPRSVEGGLTSPENYIAYIKESLRTNKPYNQFMHEMLTAKGEVFKPGNGTTVLLHARCRHAAGQPVKYHENILGDKYGMCPMP
ncbi:MAG: DUF1549 domain-containing protein [Lentisphaerales bacterium]|nr:DUF1549 domain-containing protein [Lentisphaerales bacterium]